VLGNHVKGKLNHRRTW